MQAFLTYLQSIQKLSAKAIEDIEKVATQNTFPKKHLLVSNLAQCHYLYFIESGVARAFFNHIDKEITDWFGVENMIIGPTIRNFPIKETLHKVELLEEANIVSISFNSLEQLYNKHHEIEKLGRKIALQTILHLQYKIDSLQLLTAKERYEDFLIRYPSLINRVSLQYIASYLGMNQVTLSRIRKEK